MNFQGAAGIHFGKPKPNLFSPGMQFPPKIIFRKNLLNSNKTRRKSAFKDAASFDASFRRR